MPFAPSWTLPKALYEAKGGFHEFHQKLISTYKASDSLDKQKHALDKYDKNYEANENFGNDRSGHKDSFEKILSEKMKKTKN